ncbi:MAG: ubiquinol-cytochrome c reductase core subunit 1 [Stictis urceolatum]|nr:ubiquinol-cytochrome c reductase core subunit 1 [Stictis urceolata]
MISRIPLGRNVQLCLQKSSRSSPIPSRGLAAAASGSFSYETGDASGVKYASRDLPGATTTLAVVAKAGTRYQPLPGFTEGLEKFAFKSTNRRSALRITREAELLGGELISTHSRENLVIGAKFLKADLPYFVELLGEVISQTQYTLHEYAEEVYPTIRMAQKALLARTNDLAINSAHSLAFHRGLGAPLHPTSSTPLSKYLNANYLGQFSQVAYTKPNIAVVANGADPTEFGKWVKEFFANTPSASSEQISSIQSKYYGGEERIDHASGNSIVIGLPGSSTFTGGFWKPEIAVLAALLGGQSSVKWSPGFSALSQVAADNPGVTITTKSAVYSDAGLLYIMLSGNSKAMRQASEKVVEAIRSVANGKISSEDFKKAVAAAKFRALETGQDVSAGIELTGAGLIHGGKAHQIDEVGKSIESVTESQLKNAAKTLLEGKATVSSVGDLYVLPYAEEIGLTV